MEDVYFYFLQPSTVLPNYLLQAVLSLTVSTCVRQVALSNVFLVHKQAEAIMFVMQCDFIYSN